MDESVKDLISALTELVQQLKDTKTGDVESDHPGIIKNAFAKTKGQEEREKNEALAEAITEKQKEAEEEKGRKIVQTISPVMLVGFESKALKQISDVISGNIEVDDDKKKKTDGGGGFGWLGDMFGVLGSLAATVLPFLGGAFMTAIGAIGSFLGTIIGVVAGPIGLAILALTGIAAFFTGFWEEYQENGDVGDAIIAGMGEVFDWLIGFPLTLLKDLITWSMEQLGFEDEAAYIDENWDEWLGWIKEFFLAPYRIIVGVFESVWSGISQAWDGVKDIFGGVGALLTGDFEKAGDLFYSAFQNIFGGLWDILYAIPNTVINWFMELFGFKAPDDEPFDIGDMLWDTIMEIFDWFVLLFTKPEEAFKKIGDWFDRLFEDPVGAFKELLPDWLVDFGVWVYDHTIGPIVDLWNRILGDPEGSKEAFLDLMPDWLRDIASWVWDRTIGPAVELWNKVFGHPDGAKAGFKALLPEWLWNIMEWIYDHTIGPVVGLFSDLFDGKDVEATFRKYLPDWIVDTFLWIKNTVFGGITTFFSKLFSGDIEGAFRAILPDWLVDSIGWVVDNVFGPITTFWSNLFSGDIEGAFRAILPDWLVDSMGWVVDNVFGPITDFFGTLFSGDIIGAFKKILPDWLIDFFGWMGDKIFGPIGDWFSGIWDKITDVGAYAKKKLKEKYPLMYDTLFGEQDAHAEALKKQEDEARKQLAGTGMQGEDVDNMMKDMQNFHAEVMTNKGTFNDTSRVHDDTVANQKKLKQYFDDLGEKTEHSLDDATWRNMMQGIKDNRFAATTLGKDLAAYVGKSTTEITMEDKAKVEKFFRDKVHADEWGSADDITDKYTDMKGNAAGGGINELGMFMAQHHAGKLAHDAKANSLYKILAKNLSFPVKYKNEQGDEVAALVKYATNADGTLKYDKGGMELLTEQFMTPAIRDAYRAIFTTNKQYGGVLEAMSRHMTDSEFQKAIDWTDNLRNKPGEELQDFIMRPGQDPVAFSKGDILLGIHKDNPPVGVGSSPELINRVDEMVKTLKENKDLQGKMLDAMVESGMMDKQGNTVVNNGGNSTVVNNTTVESTIMDFRDRVVGRLTNTGTKYS